MKRIIMLLCMACGFCTSGCAGISSDTARYIIEDSVLIKTTTGHTLSAVVVRRRDLPGPQPTALMVYIYSNREQSIKEATSAADHGYVGVVADVRGKRLSPEQVEPYENEQEDVYEVIDWISKQSWSNGKIGMYGGSYSGFAQWAGLKHKVHPALKTIVPYVAGIPGQGLPMENNVFINANYEWAFYIGNNKYTDDLVNNDRQRFRKMSRNWYMSGVAYRKLDSIDGQPNRLLQRWLEHPAYDDYWQAMVPYGKEFARIKIPVLVFDGYYNDGQASSLHYLEEHKKYNPHADDYLIIGPYDHFGAQRGGTRNLRDYKVDPIALIDTREITFQWLDYILKDGSKPAILKDRINYEVMGTNEWKHAPSIEKMHNEMWRLYATAVKKDGAYVLDELKPGKQAYTEQVVDLADRNTANFYNFPDPIVQTAPDLSTGIAFISKPLEKAITIDGKFTGQMMAAINKKDMDYSLAFYEVMPNGKYFQFSYYLARASFADDPTRRKLLVPGQITAIPFTNTKITSRLLGKGSRIMVILNINKNPFAQINYGTGKDVSDESISDAGSPLVVKWYNNSFIDIPITRQTYTFPMPDGWTMERTPLPPAFSPNVPYKGFEEIHFPPGWADNQSAEYWTVSYMFRLDGLQKTDTSSLQSFLTVYYEGLIADNVRRRHIPTEKLVPIHVVLAKAPLSAGDRETYTGVIHSLDYMAQVPISLNCRVHVKPSGKSFTPLLVEISPQPFDHPLWQQMEATAKEFD